MYSAVLVDDEPLVRIEVRDILSACNLGIEVVGEFSNGLDAINFIANRHPQLVLLDIRMPIMDGLAVLESIKDLKDSERPLVIMLSAFGELPLVRQAFRNGAFDYIAKAEIRDGKVIEILAKAVKELERTIDDEERKVQHFQRQRKEAVKKYVNDLLVGNLQIGEAMDEAVLEWIEIMGTVRCSVIAFFHDYSPIDNSVAKRKHEFFVQAVAQRLDSRFQSSFVVAAPDGAVWALVFLADASGAPIPRSDLVKAGEESILWLKQYQQLSASAAISSVFSSVADWIPHRKDMDLIVGLRFYFGCGKVYCQEDLRHYVQNDYPAAYNGSTLSAYVAAADPRAHAELEAWFSYIRKEGILLPHVGLRAYEAIVWTLEGALALSEKKMVDVLGEDPYLRIRRMPTREEVEAYIAGVLALVLPVFNALEKVKSEHPSYGELVRRIISSEYMKKLTLGSVAKRIGISEGYLSRLMVRDFGESFSECLARKRIEKAEELFKSGLKLYEIGEKVGYPNQAHFSKVFKKISGKSAQVFRSTAPSVSGEGENCP